MTPRQAGVALALAHAALVGTLGAKLLVDRARLPRGWARTMPYDPDLPIRGRYVSLRLDMPLVAAPVPDSVGGLRAVRLSILNGRLIGAAGDGAGNLVRVEATSADGRVSLQEPVAFFIPEHIPDPSVRPPGEELWAEVTVPRHGPPRPIRLGVWKDGTLTPLEMP